MYELSFIVASLIFTGDFMNLSLIYVSSFLRAYWSSDFYASMNLNIRLVVIESETPYVSKFMRIIQIIFQSIFEHSKHVVFGEFVKVRFQAFSVSIQFLRHFCHFGDALRKLLLVFDDALNLDPVFL